MQPSLRKHNQPRTTAQVKPYVKTAKMVRIPYLSTECYNSPSIGVYLSSLVIPSTPTSRYLSSTVQKRKLRIREALSFEQSHGGKTAGRSPPAPPTSVVYHNDSSSLLDGVPLRCFCLLISPCGEAPERNLKFP